MSQISDNMNCDVHLHAEIELLKQALVDKQTQLIAMETACLRESDRQVELEDSIIAWQDKYDRLYESHKRVQKVNQNLEDKLLKLVDRNSNERAQLTSDVATLSVRLAQANYNIATLQREIERYKTDMGLAIQLLQCKPDSFVSQKVTSLPLEMQSKVTQYMRLDTQSHSDSEGSVTGINAAGAARFGSYRVLPASDSPPPMCPFPPTAMVYSMRGLDDESGLAHINTANNNTAIDMLAASANHSHAAVGNAANNSNSTSTIINMNGGGGGGGGGADMISPSLMARYLQDELKASELKHCDTCLCASGSRDLQVLADTAHSYSVGTQTVLHGDANNALCLRCNSNLNSPSRTNSPYIMKLVKSSDSVISETKSSYSGSLAALDMTGYVGGGGGGGDGCDQLYVPASKRGDDLTVNPILGHHRLCDRKAIAQKQRDAAAAAAASVELQIENELRGMAAKPLTKRRTHLVLAGSALACGGVPKSPAVPVYDVQTQHQQLQLQQQQQAQQQPSQEQQQPMDTATGSTNSLWSKTSSNNNNNIHNSNATNAEGAKMFETFNRNLIKSIKSENPKVAGPRLCAMRIQNGTSNILLDNIEANDGVTPVVYTRRPRFLDEELDETKDIITSASRPQSIVAAGAGADDATTTTAAASAAINNKTDYEKYRDGPMAGSAPTQAPLMRKDLLSGSSMSISTTTNDRSPQLEPVVLSAAKQQQYQQEQQQQQHHHHHDHHNHHHHHSHHQQCTPTSGSVTPSSGGAAVGPSVTAAGAVGAPLKSATHSSSMSSTDVPDVQESAQLRRQQLSRVAAWVQSNHHDGVACTAVAASAGSRKPQQSGAEQTALNTSAATSIDSGYKTKAAQPYHNNINNNMDNVNGTTTMRSGQQLTASSSLSDDHKVDAMPVQLVQNVCNNNSINGRHDKRCMTMATTATTTTSGEEDGDIEESSGAVTTADATSQIDFAQMEYNVKQFLLKQNEWSTAAPTLLPQQQQQQQHQQQHPSQGGQATHRTETNL